MTLFGVAFPSVTLHPFALNDLKKGRHTDTLHLPGAAGEL